MLWLFLVFLTLPHLEPALLNRIPVLEMTIDVWRGVSFAIMVFWLVITRRKISLVVALAAVWQFSILVSTMMHHGEIYKCIVTAFSMLSIMLLYDVASKEDEIFLSSQLFCFELVIYVNLLTELLYPNGMYVANSFPYAPNWFLGYYNGYTKYCVPALMFAWLYKEKSGKKLRTYLLTGGILLSAILVFAGGFALSLLCMILVFLFFKNRTRIFNYINYWLIHIFFFFFIFVLKLQNLFSWLVDDLLGKMVSLLSRMDIWEQTLVYIRKSPLIGYGVQATATRVAEYHSTWKIHAHNMLLELLYQGGFIGLGLWICIVIVAGRKLMRYGYTMESKIISVAFLGWCIATLVEPFTTPFLMGMFVIAYRSNREQTEAGKLSLPVNGGAGLSSGRLC